MVNTFRKIYKKMGNTGTSSDYQLVGNIGVDGVELDIMKGASASSDGEIGLVPKSTTGEQDYLLSGDATFKSIDTILEKSSLIGNVDISDAGSSVTDSIKKLYDTSIIKPYYRANTISGSQSHTIAVARCSLIAIGRDGASQHGLYMIDHFGAIITIIESGSFVALSYSNSRLTIQNNIQVAISYMIISPLT